jgi:alkylated DNA repair protein alkB family protein 4
VKTKPIVSYRPFSIVEASALEYIPDVSSNLAPHLDDTWIWGPRVAGLSLLATCNMTFLKVFPTSQRASHYAVDEKEEEDKKKSAATVQQLPSAARGAEQQPDSIKCSTAPSDPSLMPPASASSAREDATGGEGEQAAVQVSVLLPRRAVFLLSGPARYEWMHGIRAEAVESRRVSITMRELRAEAEGVSETTVAAVRQFASVFV